MEYKVVDLSLDEDDGTEILNGLAADGWELMQVAPISGWGDAEIVGTDSALFAILRRPDEPQIGPLTVD